MVEKLLVTLQLDPFCELLCVYALILAAVSCVSQCGNRRCEATPQGSSMKCDTHRLANGGNIALLKCWSYPDGAEYPVLCPTSLHTPPPSSSVPQPPLSPVPETSSDFHVNL